MVSQVDEEMSMRAIFEFTGVLRPGQGNRRQAGSVLSAYLRRLAAVQIAPSVLEMRHDR
jgi:hypothetical protein